MSERPTIYDEDVRLQTTTTAEPAECECWDWCNDGTHRREEMLAGHHYRCPQFESEFRRRALVLIERLRDAMRDWGNEEDGIPEEAWDAWAIANAVINGCAENDSRCLQQRDEDQRGRAGREGGGVDTLTQQQRR